MIKRKIRIKRKKVNKILIYPVLFFLAVVFIAGHDGFIRMFGFYRRLAHLKTHINEMEYENKKLGKEINSLLYDKEYIESIAREELGLIKQGEVVYKFVEIPKDTPVFPGEIGK